MATVPTHPAIADAVAAEINGPATAAGALTWPDDQAVQAVRTYYPLFEQIDVLTAMQISVVPRRQRLNNLFRRGAAAGLARFQRQYQIDVAVQVKPADVSNASLDPFAQLTHDLQDYFDGRAYLKATVNGNQVRSIDSIIDPFPAQEHLDQYGVWTAILQLTMEIFQ